MKQSIAPVAVVTCMDPRVDPAAALGLDSGTPFVVRNAGARVTDDVVRSLAIAAHARNVTSVTILQHTDCALERATEAELESLVGATLPFLTIDDHRSAIVDDVARLAAVPFLAPITLITGMLYDLEQRRCVEITQWVRPG